MIAAAVVVLVGAGVVLLRPAPGGVAAPASVAPSASPARRQPKRPGSPDTPPDAAPPGPDRLGEGIGPTLILTVPAGESGWSLDGTHLEKDYGPARWGPAIYRPVT